MKTATKQNIAAGEKHLSSVDPLLKPLIEMYGPCQIKPHKDYYHSLVRSIVGQQLSVKAARSIFTKFSGLFEPGFPSPKDILLKEPDELRQVGLSWAKVKYIQDLAKHLEEGTLDLSGLDSLSNQEIISKLTAVKGVGEWTAHMFLMSTMGRLDVLPHGDLGIKNGIEKIYGLGSFPTPKQVQDIAKNNNWTPYESIASWYVWKSLDNA